MENETQMPEKHDPENPPLTAKDFKRAVHARKVPDKVARLRKKARTRGPQKAPLKQPVYMRLDPQIIAHFKAGGRGWQTRLNDVLAKYVKRRR